MRSHPRPARAVRSVALAAGLAGVLVLSACGGGSSSGSGATTTAAPSSAASSSGASSSGASSSGSSAPGTGSTTASQSDIDAAKAALIASGTLTTCTHLPYAPFQSNDDDGNTVGFDVDMIDLVAKELGVKQAIVDTPFEGIKSGQDLSSGKCDIAAAGMTITPDREKVILFSEPYFDATQALLVRSDESVTSLADLKGKKLGAQSSTTGLDYANAQAAANGYEIVEYQDLASEQQALVTNQIDGAINDLPVWSEFVKEQPDKTKIVAQFDTGEQYGFGMKLGNTALKSVADAAINKAKADGTYDQLYTKWIGQAPTS
ncbi:transporter substrate-binding domain-containing protein [Nakamurella flava]|uniref:transporter substrate-binding domain-containing protein n=1 Tax=Nakamurella flava TaxID=2576308 RepID=UPI00197BCF9C|nr:transporter substrate-binding domain-containing protein [Nakamurella flava]